LTVVVAAAVVVVVVVVVGSSNSSSSGGGGGGGSSSSVLSSLCCYYFAFHISFSSSSLPFLEGLSWQPRKSSGRIASTLPKIQMGYPLDRSQKAAVVV
jgi:hypothetical protein